MDLEVLEYNMAVVKNKWNGKTYRIVEDKETTIVLERENKSTFEIAKSEFKQAYYRIEKEDNI